MTESDYQTPQSAPHRLRLGIIGCGAIAEISHLRSALALPLVDVVALSDSDPARLRRLRRLYDLPDIGFTDYREVLGRVDAVVLAVPNHLHACLGADFLTRGIHVLCEKPLAPNMAECERLCHVARSNSAVLAVGYVTRFFPSTLLTRELLDRRFLGPVLSFDYQFGTAGGWAPVSGYNLSRASAGGGVLVLSGSHFLDRMLYLFGRTRVVSYADDAHGGVEANCVAICEFSDDGRPFRGTITLSKTHRLANRLRMVGENGALEIREGQSESVSFFPADRGLQYEITYPSAAPRTDYFRLQLEDFVQAIRRGAEPRVNGEEASASVAVIEECYRTADTLNEVWADATLERLRTALPPVMAQDQETQATATAVTGVAHAR